VTTPHFFRRRQNFQGDFHEKIQLETYPASTHAPTLRKRKGVCPWQQAQTITGYNDIRDHASAIATFNPEKGATP
jgi:hypothetical protein